MSLPQPYVDSKPLSIEEVELDKPGQREVLVQIKAASLCHSDLSTVNGDRPRQMPMVLGHEASGIVQEIGGGINDLKVGDHVALVFAPSCGQCPPCVEGHPGRCEPGQQANGAGKLLNGGMRLSQKGEPAYHHAGPSPFAEDCAANPAPLCTITSPL